MGGRRLPRKEIALGAAALAVLALTVACGTSPSPAATGPSVAASVGVDPTLATTATATPTPDVLASPPTNAGEARAGVQAAILAGDASACPTQLQARWNVRCTTGDLDGDGKPDAAFLVPLKPGSPAGTAPAAVFVLRSKSMLLDEIRLVADADASRLGQEFFGIEQRVAAGKNLELSVLSAACNAAGCSYGVHVETWDGAAWRDIGPVDAIDDLDHVAFVRSGEAWDVVTHTSPARPAGAGPVRSISARYSFDGRRFSLAAQTPDPPVYLYSAIQDADAKFEEARNSTGDWAAAIDAYRAAIANKDLKDWQQETRGVDGRSALESYALFRIAVATAASGADPTAAIDAGIRDARDPLFIYGTEQFREGFLERVSVHAGCVAATKYFGLVGPDADNPAHLRQVFDYGYANLPVRQPADLCPL